MEIIVFIMEVVMPGHPSCQTWLILISTWWRYVKWFVCHGISQTQYEVLRKSSVYSEKLHAYRGLHVLF